MMGQKSTAKRDYFRNTPKKHTNADSMQNKCTKTKSEKTTKIGTTEAMPAKQRQDKYTHNGIRGGRAK